MGQAKWYEQRRQHAEDEQYYECGAATPAQAADAEPPMRCNRFYDGAPCQKLRNFRAQTAGQVDFDQIALPNCRFPATGGQKLPKTAKPLAGLAPAGRIHS